MKKRLLYGVDHAITTSSDGYAIRTQGLAKALCKAGIDLKVVAGPSEHTNKLPIVQKIDGVQYLHLQERHVHSYLHLLKVFKPDVVLAASNWRHADPLKLAAQMLGLPFWYEARGFWELSRCAKEPGFASTPEFQREVAGETDIALASEHLFTLNQHMADEWVRRQVPGSKISLIPNGLTSIPSTIPKPDQVLKKELGLTDGKVIAYIGSFSGYEGLDDLITAFSIARRKKLNARLLLVGSLSKAGSNSACQSSDRLRNLADQLGVSDHLVTTGRVPPDEVANYFPLIDLMVIPRRPERVCEIVSPIKHLEAAAYGTQLLVSNVAPLADLQSLGPGVKLFEKGSIESLAEQLATILREPTPPRCPKILYPELENLLWSSNIEPLLKAIRETPPQLKRSLPWQNNN